MSTRQDPAVLPRMRGLRGVPARRHGDVRFRVRAVRGGGSRECLRTDPGRRGRRRALHVARLGREAGLGGGGKARASGAVEVIAQDGGATRASPVKYRAVRCPHGRQKSRCKSCGGGSLCSHGRVRSRCKTCGGGSICPHGRERSGCKPCGGGSICEHNRQRSRCKAMRRGGSSASTNACGAAARCAWRPRRWSSCARASTRRRRRRRTRRRENRENDREKPPSSMHRRTRTRRRRSPTRRGRRRRPRRSRPRRSPKLRHRARGDRRDERGRWVREGGGAASHRA